MKFGHHGINHPVLHEASDDDKQKVAITSQNHGFRIDEQSLPDGFLVSHRSLFDGTIQGIVHRHKPIMGFQGHPEAGPGPHDVVGLFYRFITLLQ